MSEHPPGTIVVLNHDTGRFSATHECLLSVQHPPGTRIQHLKGADVAYARNQALEHATGDWVWFMDDDHAWDDPQLLLRLLDRQVDLVQPLVLRRVPPFSPVVTRQDAAGEYYPCDVHELGTPADGIVPVASCGMGGTLIRRHVWEAMDKPWFRVGTIQPDKLGEDVAFTRRLAAHGFQAWVDLAHPLEHLRVGALKPVWREGRGWLTAVVLDEVEVLMPASVREKD